MHSSRTHALTLWLGLSWLPTLRSELRVMEDDGVYYANGKTALAAGELRLAATFTYEVGQPPVGT